MTEWTVTRIFPKIRIKEKEINLFDWLVQMGLCYLSVFQQLTVEYVGGVGAVSCNLPSFVSNRSSNRSIFYGNSHTNTVCVCLCVIGSVSLCWLVWVIQSPHRTIISLLIDFFYELCHIFLKRLGSWCLSWDSSQFMCFCFLFLFFCFWVRAADH